jgi:hypothetical protein
MGASFFISYNFSFKTLLMARIKFGTIATEIRGSIGGTCFQSNRYGFTIKNKSNPGNLSTVNQQLPREAIFTITQSWAQLTNAQRLAWNTFATTYPQPCKHNSSANLSGYNLFLKYNIYAYLGGSGFVSSPAFSIPSLPVFHPVVYSYAGDVSYNFFPSFSELNLFALVGISAPVSPSNNFVGSKCRNVFGTVADSTPITVTPQYLANFGIIPAIGNTVFMSISPYGTTTPWFFAPQSFKLIVQ